MGLCLNRSLGERIFLDLPNGDRQAIKVLEIGKKNIRLVIDAPPYVTISREELSPGAPHESTQHTRNGRSVFRPQGGNLELAKEPTDFILRGLPKNGLPAIVRKPNPPAKGRGPKPD